MPVHDPNAPKGFRLRFHFAPAQGCPWLEDRTSPNRIEWRVKLKVWDAYLLDRGEGATMKFLMMSAPKLRTSSLFEAACFLLGNPSGKQVTVTFTPDGRRYVIRDGDEYCAPFSP